MHIDTPLDLSEKFPNFDSRHASLGREGLGMNLSLLELFDRFCPGPSFDPWRDVLRGAGFVPGQEPLNRDLWTQVSGGRTPLTKPPSELILAIARGAGKTQNMSLIATHKALSYRKPRWFSQRPFVLFTAIDMRQADEALNYSRQLLDHPSLRPTIAGDLTKRVITLKTGIREEVLPSDGAKLRGRGAIVVSVDEFGHYPAADGADLLTAIRPMLGRVPESLLITASTKYRRAGSFYDLWKSKFGVNDPDVLVIDADTLTMNPTFDRRVIARAFEEDPIAAMSEYGRDGHTDWRADVAGLLTPEAIAACTSVGVLERPPMPGLTYRAFVDAAGGSGSDSMTLAIAYTDRTSGREVLAATREVTPPFSPAAVVKDFADALKRYAVSTAMADRWGSEWVRELFMAHGIRIEPSPWTKSEIYLFLLPLVNSGLVELTDDPRTARQLSNLERKAGGQVDHPVRGHDDRANSVAGALVCGRAASQQHYRVRCIGVTDGPAPAPRAGVTLSQPDDIPAEIIGNADRIIEWIIRTEPEILADPDPIGGFAQLWPTLVQAGIAPAWNQTVRRIAVARLRAAGVRHVA